VIAPFPWAIIRSVIVPIRVPAGGPAERRDAYTGREQRAVPVIVGHRLERRLPPHPVVDAQHRVPLAALGVQPRDHRRVHHPGATAEEPLVQGQDSHRAGHPTTSPASLRAVDVVAVTGR
jgi:hypothetical protein